jgi:hypothetical protein
MTRTQAPSIRLAGIRGDLRPTPGGDDIQQGAARALWLTGSRTQPLASTQKDER